MSNVKVIMLAGRGESTVLMYNGIKDFFSVEKVIIESSVSKVQLLKHRFKKLGLMTVVGQILFMIFNLLVLKKISRTRINEIRQQKKLDSTDIAESKIIRVDSVNSDETSAIIKKYQPDIVVVNGTRIIKKEILETASVPFINSHVGITPKYRGVHGAYWALTESDVDNCGVTIHLVDAGIDTGDILYQSKIKVTDQDDFNTYPYLQIAEAVPLMRRAISNACEKAYKTQCISNQKSRLWSHPTIVEYLKYRILLGVK